MKGRGEIAVVAALVLASAGAASAQSKVVKVGTPAQGFSIVLVQGDLRAGVDPRAGVDLRAVGAADELPPAARKALGDMRDFLPYRSYQLLDTQWTLGVNRARTRLRGAGSQEYEIELQAHPAAERRVRIGFQLREPRGTHLVEGRREHLRRLEAELGGNREKFARLVESLAAGPSSDIEQQRREAAERITALSTQLQYARAELTASSIASLHALQQPLIDTTFNMAVGETVVVGTSRLQGDKALIVLLTAVEKSLR